MELGKSFPGLSLVTFLSQMNPVHVLAYFVLKNRFNIVLQFMPRSSKMSVSFRLSNQNLLCNSLKPHTCRLPSPFYPSGFDHPNYKLCGLQFTRYLDVHFSSFSCYFFRSAFKMSSSKPALEQRVTSPQRNRQRQSPGILIFTFALIKQEGRKFLIHIGAIIPRI